jgi:hypothetical protein
MLNQHGEIVLTVIGIGMFSRRADQLGEPQPKARRADQLGEPQPKARRADP